jgi:dihydroorotate dehydrogenase
VAADESARSVINRCGFNSKGAEVAAKNLEAFAKSGEKVKSRW